MKLRPITSAVLLSLSLMTVSAVQAQEERRSYIVQLADKPAATYEGEVAGLAATKPPTGQRLNVDASDVRAYISYLDAKQADVMSTIAGAEITNEFKVVFNGFSAMLTDAEVRALKKNSKVAAITADSILQLDTSYTPGFIGVDGPNGLWSKLGGQGAAGENMIIGIIDSGIWPEHVSFADRIDSTTNTPSHTGDQQVYSAPPAGWKGTCEVGEGFSAANCNNKLIGARSFKTATQTFHWTEFNSARDSVAGAEGSGGHGTHTASTAGGNAGSPAIINGLNLGKVSGIAPRARIAAYKVCWTSTAGTNGCATSNSVAAVEAAVKDGVNVINFSIGPNAGGGSFSEATEQAFLGAAAAGVFVATSAGNGGPGATNVTPTAHLSPWLTSVGNTSHNRLYIGDAELGNGVKLTGASSNAKNAPTQLILARDAGKEGVDPNTANLRLCFGGTDVGSPILLDPIKVTGKILVCDRGSNVLVNKSANAKAAGAVGVIITNTPAVGSVPASANTIINQAHTVSTIHMVAAEGVKLKTYMAANPGTATASMGNLRTTIDTTVNAPVMSVSSSRGPNVANANILKPDVSAPGSDILAAVTADLTKDERNAVAAGGASPSSNFAFYSGTSMASPHIAGMAALLKQSHPDWTPAMIKSALMTTAMDVFGDAQNGAQAWDPTARFNGNLPWGQGAGFARPTLANDPGLVYDAGLPDYIRFMCGANVLAANSAACTTNGSIQPSDLNLASLTVADMLGVQTIKRSVTNVGPAGTYTPTVTLPGFSVVVEPASLTLATGEKADYTVKLTRTTAPFNAWVYGKLTWSDGTRTVRSPLTVRASSMVTAPKVTSEATTGSKFLTIGTGFTGAMTVDKAGLLAATQDTSTVLQSPTQTSATNRTTCTDGGGTGVNVHNFTIPTGTRLIRFATFDSDTGSNGASDIDMIVLRMTATTTGTLVGSSGSDTSNENVQLFNPAAGNYRVCMIGYAPKNGAETYKLSSWILSPTAVGGNLKASAPSKVVAGGTGTVGIAWSGLPVGKRHMGVLTYMTGTTVLGNTVLEVDTTDPLPLFQNARSAPVLAE